MIEYVSSLSDRELVDVLQFFPMGVPIYQEAHREYMRRHDDHG